MALNTKTKNNGSKRQTENNGSKRQTKNNGFERQTKNNGFECYCEFSDLEVRKYALVCRIYTPLSMVTKSQ